MCEVHLPIHGRVASPGLVDRKGRGSDNGVVVCVLANWIGLGNLFKVSYVSWTKGNGLAEKGVKSMKVRMKKHM
jgi:hypothetical protein